MQNFLISCFLLVSLFVSAQTEDSAIIFEKLNSKVEVHYQPKYLFSDSKPIIKFNPITLVSGGLLFLYQKVISPQIFADCLYDISCSNFGVLSIKRYGLIKGTFLTSDRLTRCTQFSAQDITAVRINKETGKVIDNIEWYHNH